MERTKFYETLFKNALEFASSRDLIYTTSSLIQQTDLVQQNTTNSTPKCSNQIEY